MNADKFKYRKTLRDYFKFHYITDVIIQGEKATKVKVVDCEKKNPDVIDGEIYRFEVQIFGINSILTDDIETLPHNDERLFFLAVESRIINDQPCMIIDVMVDCIMHKYRKEIEENRVKNTKSKHMN